MFQIPTEQELYFVHSAVGVEDLLGEVRVRIVGGHGGLQLASSPTDEGGLLRSNGNGGRGGTEISTWWLYQ